METRSQKSFKKKNKAVANTVNKGKLFVMLFADFEPFIGIGAYRTPGYAPVPFTTFYTRINYQPLINLVPRHCASAHLSNLYTRINFQPLRNLVPRSLTNAITFVPGRQKARHTCLATGITSRLKYRD